MDYGEMTERQRKACGVATSELFKVQATPEEVQRRALIYRQHFDATLTPNALANQWAAVREVRAPAAPTRPSLMDQARALRAQREAS
jgi:hypothetical protein